MRTQYTTKNSVYVVDDEAGTIEKTSGDGRFGHIGEGPVRYESVWVAYGTLWATWPNEDAAMRTSTIVATERLAPELCAYETSPASYSRGPAELCESEAQAGAELCAYHAGVVE